MPTETKRWIVVELRNGQIFNLLVASTQNPESCGEWLEYTKKLQTAEINVQHHKERDLLTPRDIQGEPKKILGPHLPAVEGMRIYSEDRRVRVSDIVDWSEATEYWAEACNKALGCDMAAWDSALKPGPRIVTANESILKKINEDAKNGEVPRIRLEK